MSALLLALAAGYGTHLAWTARVHGWTGLGLGPKINRALRVELPWSRWLVEAGLHEVRPLEFALVTGAVSVSGLAAASALFGLGVPALLCGIGCALLPAAAHRRRRAQRMELAQESWPRIIEELRILTGSAGRSVPQALFEAAAHGPDEIRWAFQVVEREWSITADFSQTVSHLKALLTDPSADATLELLLIAHEIGGGDLDRRLLALANDRTQDLDARRTARAEQAGVRFARRFVLIVPIGMALVGLSIGPGRASYQEPSGQAAAVVGLALVAVCWIWAGRIMRLPTPSRVLAR